MCLSVFLAELLPPDDEKDSYSEFLNIKTMKMKPKKPKIGCLVDGEHYIPNIKDTLDKVSGEHDIEVAIFIGGTEKIGDKLC